MENMVISLNAVLPLFLIIATDFEDNQAQYCCKDEQYNG